MLTWAIVAALAGAFFFALAATLQQREAGRDTTAGVADPRLLWRLAHRPLWLVGIAADGLSAGLHVLALALGSISLVQPLGVTGLLFAIPMVAILRRRRIPGRDIVAALVVLAGLVVMLRLIPTYEHSDVVREGAVIAVVAVTLALAAALTAVGHLAPGRTASLVLAAGAGISFGVTATLVRGLLQLPGRPHAGLTATVAGVGIALIIPAGYLMLQNAYRAGHFAASLATAVVMDPIAAILAGIPVLEEPLPADLPHALAAIAAAAVIASGIAVLVRSPARLFTVADEHQESAEVPDRS